MARDPAETKAIMAQTAYKVAGWIHAAEINTGASADFEYLHEMARKVTNGMFKLAGGSPPAESTRGGVTGEADPSAPSCPRCNEPMEPNKNWTGLGNVEGHKKSESIRWRCSQRGMFVKDRGWSGCDGVKWEDVKGAA